MEETELPASGVRRVPRGARGQQRVEVILDAAEQLFAEVGYEAATTNQIAAQAGIAIGSIYQFFSNKEALLAAVTARYVAELAAAYQHVLTPQLTTESLPALAERLIDITLEFGSQHMGFSRIVLQAAADPHLAAAAQALMGEISAQVEALLHTHAPWLGDEQRALYATVSVTAVTALLAVGSNAKHTGAYELGHALAEQAKLLLVVYLRHVAAPPDDTGGQR